MAVPAAPPSPSILAPPVRQHSPPGTRLKPRTLSRRAPNRGLTLRSRRGPTAGHQARAGGTGYIFTGPGLASCRRSRLTSNVRPHMTPSPCTLMAEYNRWMNLRLYEAAAKLPEPQIFEDRRAFFGSLFDTLNHIVVAD